SSAKPFSRSAETGRSVASTIVVALPIASAAVTEPSSRPSVAAEPLLVVAPAPKPSEAGSPPEPPAPGVGSKSGRPPWWSARNRSARSACPFIRTANLLFTRFSRRGDPGRPYTRRVDRALLESTLAAAGEPAYRASQVWEWVARGARDYGEM